MQGKYFNTCAISLAPCFIIKGIVEIMRKKVEYENKAGTKVGPQPGTFEDDFLHKRLNSKELKEKLNVKNRPVKMRKSACKLREVKKNLEESACPVLLNCKVKGLCPSPFL